MWPSFDSAALSLSLTIGATTTGTATSATAATTTAAVTRRSGEAARCTRRGTATIAQSATMAMRVLVDTSSHELAARNTTERQHPRRGTAAAGQRRARTREPWWGG